MGTTAERVEAFKFLEALKASGEHLRALRQRAKIAGENDLLALSVARRLEGLSSTEFEDLAQIARIGLLRAIDRFDVSKGRAFSSYAIPHIRGEILHHLRDHGTTIKIPRRWMEAHEQVKLAHRKLTEGGRDLSLEDVAVSLGYSKELWSEIKDTYQTLTVSSLEEIDMPQEGDDDSREERHEKAVGLFARLPIDMQQALSLRILAKKKDAAIAKQLGVTPSEVKSLIARGLDKLKEIANADNPDY
jgi:RNA polymerase sigma-B factor